MRYQNFDLLLSNGRPPDDDLYAARVLHSPGGETTAAIPLDTLDVDHMAARFERLRKRANLAEADLKRFGKTLFQGLLTEDILALFYQSVGAAGAAQTGLRLRLRLEHAAPARLPWELMFTRQQDFLATNRAFSICRYLPVPHPVTPLQTELPLRILVVVSAPEDLPPLDYEAEREVFLASLETMLTAQGVQVEFEFDATSAQILARLQTGRFHVLHFIGHGDYQNGRGLLYLENDQNLSAEADAQTIADILAASSTLRLAVLNACSTAAEGALAGFTGVASQLIQRGTPAVIAMRNEVQDQIAITFSKHLYGNLAGGEPVDLAMTRTRQQLRHEHGSSPAAFSAPILLMHTEDGVLFEIVSTRQRQLVRAAQQIVQLNETSETLAEWKQLHDLLQILAQPLNTAYQLSNTLKNPAIIQGIWGQFNHSLDARLLPFAAGQIRYIGRPYTPAPAPSGEEWAVRMVEFSGAVDRALINRNLDAAREQMGQLRNLVSKHLSRCNRKIVRLTGQVAGGYTIARDALETLQDETAPDGSAPPLNWPAITGDLAALESRQATIQAWVNLHDLFDRLRTQFALLAFNAPRLPGVALLAGQWHMLRDNLVVSLLDQARELASANQPATPLAGSSAGEAAQILILQHKSDQLDTALRTQNTENARQLIQELDGLIDRYYLQVDRTIRQEMTAFTRRSIALQTRVSP